MAAAAAGESRVVMVALDIGQGFYRTTNPDLNNFAFCDGKRKAENGRSPDEAFDDPARHIHTKQKACWVGVFGVCVNNATCLLVPCVQ